MAEHFGSEIGGGWMAGWALAQASGVDDSTSEPGALSVRGAVSH